MSQDKDGFNDQKLYPAQNKNQETSKFGKSLFRNKNGGPMYMKVNSSNTSEELFNMQSEEHLPQRTTKSSEHPRTDPSNEQTLNKEAETNPDSLPKHPTVGSLKRSEKAKRLNLAIPQIFKSVDKPSQDAGHQEKSHDEANTEESRANLVRKSVDKDSEDRKVSFKPEFLDPNATDEHGKTSAVSPNPRFSFFSLSSLKSRKKDKTKEKDDAKNNNTSPTHDEIARRQRQLDDIQPVNMENLNIYGDPDGGKVIKESLKLISQIKFPRTFIDPLLDIVNRFCLEYISLCVRTYPEKLLVLQIPEHFSRVYNYMQVRADCVSTPIYDEFPGPEVPVIITRLFLNDFRMSTDGTNQSGVYLPMFMHSNRMSEDKFKAMVTNIFAIRYKFFQTVDVSRHGLADLT